MALNRVELGRSVTFVKFFASVVPLRFLPKSLSWNKIMLLKSNLLNFPELVINEVKKSISKSIYQRLFSYPSYHCLMQIFQIV